MDHTDALQLVALLGLWLVACALDGVGLLRHVAGERHWDWVIGELSRRGQVDLIPEARTQRMYEQIRAGLKAGLAAWALATVMQRWRLGDEAPLSWESWVVLGAHYYLLTVLTIWTQRERRTRRGPDDAGSDT